MNRRESLIAFVALGAVAGSIASFAQGKVWRVGFLSLYSASEIVQNTAAFLKALRELGYVEAKNLVVEWRFAEGNFERLPDLAADLVQLKVDVIVAVASAAISAAKNATSTIPIVMATTGDPVGSGFVKSLARPGGNITGLSNMGGDTGAKLLDLLLTAVPKVSRVGVLVTPTSTTYRAISESIQAGAQNTSVKVLIAEARTPQEIETAFAMMAKESAGAVIVGAAPLFALHRPQIAQLAIKYKMPSIFGNRAYVEAGGLMSYGYKLTENYLRAASYVDKILKGAKPGDVPVEQPTKFELVVNLKAAKALGITIPQSILLRADRLIQ
jgi:putative tryptophan/tyrosine transport system substrate-binding protein